MMMDMLWRKKNGVPRKGFKYIADTIERWEKAIGMGHTKRSHRPLPFNHYNMTSLAISELAHARIMGILGRVYMCFLKCVHKKHRMDMQEFWCMAPKSRGISSILNITRYKDGKDPRASKKAMKLWTSVCLCLLICFFLYEVHKQFSAFFYMVMREFGEYVTS
ncbi:MAG: hypothetical protein GY714_23270 [Desulfobacterales bacterium]|nr:hypothetical protein [Desulfobacterales bacterium]